MRSKRELSPKIKQQLKRLGVEAVYLYGSQAIGRSNRLSDVDVGVVLRDPKPLRDRRRRARLYLKLSDCLTPALAPGLHQEMDLVLLQTASPILQFEAINVGRPLFVADPVFRADYEASIVRDYLDVRPMVEVHYQAVLDRAA